MYTDEQKHEAKKLFLQGVKIPEIETALGIQRRTLYGWAEKELWGEMITGQSSLYAAHRRLQTLIGREKATDLELKEIETLVGVVERLEKIEAVKLAAARSPDGGEGRPAQGERKKRKSTKNDFTAIAPDLILEKFREGLFAYQLELYAVRDQRIRNILKSRQIGLTYYFAREAFVDALLTGDNQIFLSASRAQADVFRSYVKSFARDWFGMDLKGKDAIELITPHGVATLYFLSTNSTTAQSYHGHVYVDEYFWIPKFDTLNKVASAMASHKKWRKTYFSTPSAKSHAAYPFWSGDLFNERMKSKNKPVIKFPSGAELTAGKLCPDGQYRRVITVVDAENHGCDLFDIEQLKLEYSDDAFQQLFMCKFIDDSASVFQLSELEHCLDDISEWRDFRPGAPRPYLGPVWIGYDPSRSRDGACIVVVAPPLTPGGKFRVLEKINLHNQAWQYQAAVIEKLCEKYQVKYIGIDITGPGSGVFEQVQGFYPAAKAIFYTLDQKTQLVLKAQQVIGDRRLLWDASWSDIAAGFMQIHKVVTGGSQITYVADRSDKTGHADAAWAIMHALINEGLVINKNKVGSRVVFQD